MNTFKLPLPNGMVLTLSKPIKSVKPISALTVDNQPKPKFLATFEEMQDISVALLYYKGYLKQKGQLEKADKIKAIDDKIFAFLSVMQQYEEVE
jgi:hypothetical protein